MFTNHKNIKQKILNKIKRNNEMKGSIDNNRYFLKKKDNYQT